MAGLDVDLVRHALTIARRDGYAEVELELDSGSFSAKLAPRKKRAAAASFVETSEPTLAPIKADHVGYYQPSDPPLEVGGAVKKGDVVASISALGLGHDLVAPIDGEVVEVLVEAGRPVMYGQPIAMVKPA
jgi:biotin carboxyl carrier protein